MINSLEIKRLTVALFIRKFPMQWISVNKLNEMINIKGVEINTYTLGFSCLRFINSL